ncbi:MAG: endonuclease NucS [Gammaproteobacteria bacterium]|nr:endonuclease NucS [Gammaproteobacteria bacterium]
MAVYDKPTRVLMHEMVKDLGISPGQQLSRQTIMTWFANKYPKLKSGTISAHIIKMTTNAPSRRHYHATPGSDDLFFQTDRSTLRLYDSESDPAPLGVESQELEAGISEAEDEDEYDETRTGAGAEEFAYEADLKNYLSKNLHVLEPGLTLFEDEGISGIEFPVGGRYIDILAKDDNGGLVVIELKVSRGYDRVVGQLMRYMAWISEHMADADQDVRGIIVAREISKDLLMASSLLAKVSLFEYKLALSVSKVQ